MNLKKRVPKWHHKKNNRVVNGCISSTSCDFPARFRIPLRVKFLPGWPATLHAGCLWRSPGSVWCTYTLWAPTAVLWGLACGVLGSSVVSHHWCAVLWSSVVSHHWCAVLWSSVVWCVVLCCNVLLNALCFLFCWEVPNWIIILHCTLWNLGKEKSSWAVWRARIRPTGYTLTS